MSNSQNIITDIQQTIRLEFKKLGQAKTKAEVLTDSNLIYRSICNNANSFVKPLEDLIEVEEFEDLAGCFREYLIAFAIGKPRNMSLYSFKIVEWFLNSWFLNYGGYEKCKKFALSEDYSKRENLTTLFDLVRSSPDVPAANLKTDLTKLYYGFNQLELYPIRNQNNFRLFPDHDSFAIWKYMRDGYAHGGIVQYPYASKRKMSSSSENVVNAKNERELKFLQLKEDEDLSNPVLADFNLFILTNLKFYRDLFKEAIIRN
jgi:hypothetical protein